VINRRKVKNNLRNIQRIRTWQLIVLFAISLVLTATFLRLNNIGMIERRNAVLNADRTKDEALIKTRLVALQRFVAAHMNTNMGKGIYLEVSYQTAVSNAYASAVDSKTTNVYKAAQDVCAPKFTHWSTTYVSCVADELAKYPAGQNLVSSVEKPNPNNYLHVFASPLWSSDIAGWSVLVSVVILIMIITRITSVLILKLMLRIKYRNI
jgi:hypothetical protein